MNIEDKIQYARTRLGLARAMGDIEEVNKWEQHLIELKEERETNTTA